MLLEIWGASFIVFEPEHGVPVGYHGASLSNHILLSLDKNMFGGM